MKRNADEQAKLDAAMTELFERRIAFNEVLGLKLQSLAPPTLQFQMQPQLVGHYVYGRLHGGVISATLDAMGGLALMVAIAEQHAGDDAEFVLHRFAKIGTIDLRVDFLRQGLGRHFVAGAEVMRLGGRVGTTQMRLVNDEGTLIATGAAAYMIA